MNAKRTVVRTAVGLTVFLSGYLAAELLVAPLLADRPAIKRQYFVRDVDHRMPPDDPGIPTNEDGIRSRRRAGDFTPDGYNIVFLGDSFIYGYSLELEQTIPHVVEARLRERFPERDVRVASFARVSSSPLLSYRQLSDIGARYRPDLVVLGLDMTDFHDDIKYEAMLARAGIYRWYDKLPMTLAVFRKVAPRTFWRVHGWSLSGALPEGVFFASGAPLSETRPYLQTTLRNLDAIHRLSASLGARFVLIVLPRSYQYSDRESPLSWEKTAYDDLGPFSTEPFRFFREIEASLAYPVYSLLSTFLETEVFPTCFEDDPHWNADGARVAAERIAEILEVEIERPTAGGP